MAWPSAVMALSVVASTSRCNMVQLWRSNLCFSILFQYYQTDRINIKSLVTLSMQLDASNNSIHIPIAQVFFEVMRMLGSRISNLIVGDENSAKFSVYWLTTEYTR